MKRSRMAPSSFALPKTKQYPITDVAHARNAIARVNQVGTPAQKAAVYAKVRAKFPALAKRSTVIPTKTGAGRHFGQAKGTTNRRKR